MTFPSRYEPKKKNLTDNTDVINNPTISNNNKDNEIDHVPTTIGDAVKKVIETGKEVVIQGPQTAGELTGVKESEFEEEKTGKILKQGEKDQTNLDKVSKDSKLEIDVIESATETSLLSNEEKIILNPNESETDEEAIITTVTTIPTEGVNVEAQTEFTVPLKDKEENIEVETDVQVNPTASPSSGSSFESTNIKKPNLSLNDVSFEQKSTSLPESDKDTINPKILLEKEDQTLQQQQQQTRKDFSSNPFITYSLLWQHIVSDWVSFYDEYLKNLIKFNGFWFEKSDNSSSSSQQ
ncbi:MAG TPA: hypothetical protein VF222_05260 [Nitrososphaeraceae archaeon]